MLNETTGIRSDTPMFYRRDNDEIFYVRMGNTTHQLKPSEVIAYIQQRMTGQVSAP